jgi:hypothetical protein
MFAGLAVLVLLVGAFGGWGGTAPLAGGAVASGVISPEAAAELSNTSKAA